MRAITKKMKGADNIGKYLFSVVPPPLATQLNFKQKSFYFPYFTQDYRQNKDDKNHKTEVKQIRQTNFIKYRVLNAFIILLYYTGSV